MGWDTERDAEAWGAIMEDPEGFRIFLSDKIRAVQERERLAAENAENLLKEYGVKYCPFHYPTLLRSVNPQMLSIKLGGKTYDFMQAECDLFFLNPSSRYCTDVISFDRGLIDSLKEGNMEKVDAKSHCTACEKEDGRIFYTGHDIGIGPGPFRKKSGLYLFERPCHSYVAASSAVRRIRTD